jgi:hypothetical protein
MVLPIDNFVTSYTCRINIVCSAIFTSIYYVPEHESPEQDYLWHVKSRYNGPRVAPGAQILSPAGAWYIFYLCIVKHISPSYRIGILTNRRAVGSTSFCPPSCSLLLAPSCLFQRTVLIKGHLPTSDFLLLASGS